MRGENIDFRASPDVLQRRPKKVAKPSEDVCRKCDNRSTCTRPCKYLERLLWEPGHVHERVRGRGKMTGEYVVLFPWRREFNIASLGADMEKAIAEFYDDDRGVQFQTDELNFTKTGIFIERFFHKRSRKDIAEQFGCSEDLVSHHFSNAVSDVDGLLRMMDSRRTGKRIAKSQGRFTDLQKAFILRYVLGYKPDEIEKLLPKYKANSWKAKLARLSGRIRDAFDEEERTHAITT